jgi:hypothetical protein
MSALEAAELANMHPLCDNVTTSPDPNNHALNLFCFIVCCICSRQICLLHLLCGVVGIPAYLKVLSQDCPGFNLPWLIAYRSFCFCCVAFAVLPAAVVIPAYLKVLSVDYPGFNLPGLPDGCNANTNESTCAIQCAATSGCRAFTYKALGTQGG